MIDQEKIMALVERIAQAPTCDGCNPGAINICMAIVRMSPIICDVKDLTTLELIKDWGVTGPGIWAIWKYGCMENIWILLATIWAIQYGILPKERWVEMSAGRDGKPLTPEEIELLMSKVPTTLNDTGFHFLTYLEWMMYKEVSNM